MKILVNIICLALLFVSCTKKENLGTKKPLQKSPVGEITYSVDGKKHIGYIASGANSDNPKPAIIIVHEWWGHNEYVRKRADMLADLGYVAMAIDMYGEGQKAEHPKDAMKFSKQAMSDFPLAKQRFEKAMEVLKQRDDVDGDEIVAIGYCFGGGVVLNMMRSGIDLELVASFHGSLAGPINLKKGAIETDVLVFNGASDPMVTASDIENFKDQMEKADIDYKFYNYEGAKHAFTNPGATELGTKFNLPLAYDQKADFDSWNKFLEALKEID
jgi:dienelactone hydrolase